MLPWIQNFSDGDMPGEQLSLLQGRDFKCVIVSVVRVLCHEYWYLFWKEPDKLLSRQITLVLLVTAVIIVLIVIIERWHLPTRAHFLFGLCLVLKMEVISASETLIHIRTTHSCVQEHGKFYNYRSENVKSYINNNNNNNNSIIIYLRANLTAWKPVTKLLGVMNKLTHNDTEQCN
jgi:hypothetical protein